MLEYMLLKVQILYTLYTATGWLLIIAGILLCFLYLVMWMRNE